MAKSNDVLRQIRATVDEYIEEEREQNEKRAEKDKVLAEIDALNLDAEKLRKKAADIVSVDKTARDEAVKPLISLLGLKLEDRNGTEIVMEEHEDRDGPYSVSTTRYRGYVCLVDKYGYTIFKDMVYDRYIGYGDKITREKVAEAKRAVKENYDVSSLFSKFLEDKDALSRLKEIYSAPEKWDLQSVEEEIKRTVHDVGPNAVKETLKGLKKQKAVAAKEVHKLEKVVNQYYDYSRESDRLALKNARTKYDAINKKVDVHERALNLYDLKVDLEKLTARVKSDVEKLGVFEAIDKVVPAQDKYLEVKVEADETLKSVDAIKEQIGNMQYKRRTLESSINSDDMKVVDEIIESGILAEIVAELINEDFVKTDECEDVKAECYIQLSTNSSYDDLDKAIATEVFDRIEKLYENETEREDV